MSITKQGLIRLMWENFPTIYGLLDKAPAELDSPLNDYGVSEYSDDVVQNIEASLKNIRYLIDVYAAVVGNRKLLHSSSLVLISPKIQMELSRLFEEIKFNIEMLSKHMPEVEKEIKTIISKLEPLDFYRFQKTDVSNLGPFSSAQSINFKKPFTLIVGDNGSGKTTIVKKLKSNFPDYTVHSSGLYNLSFLMFVTGEDISTPSDPSKLLLTYGIDKVRFDIQLNELLEDLRSNPRCYARLTDKYYPCATGEVIMMNIVINFALRKILRLDYPIVLDAWCGLDNDYLELFVSFLRKNCSQVIFFSLPNSTFQQIGLNSDYYLQLDDKANKSIIINSSKES